MGEILIIIGDYIKGKSVYPAFRRLLNLLLNISIASFLYEKCYGQYDLINWSDFNGLLNYFIKGNYFIPLCFFLIAYGVTDFLSQAIFLGINHFKTLKMTNKILQYQYNKDKIEEQMDRVTKVSKHITPINLSKESLIKLFNELKSNLTAEAYSELEKNLNVLKQNLEDIFKLAFRMLFAISIYFHVIPKFGWILYITSLIILVLIMTASLTAYRILDIIPVLLKKFHSEAEKYINAEANKSNQ